MKGMIKVVSVAVVLLLTSGCSVNGQMDKFKKIKKDSAMYCGTSEAVKIVDLGYNTIIRCKDGTTYMFDGRSTLEKLRDKFVK